MAGDPDSIQTSAPVMLVAIVFGLLGLWGIIGFFEDLLEQAGPGRTLGNLAVGGYFISTAFGLFRHKKWSLYLIWPPLIFVFLITVVWFLGYGLNSGPFFILCVVVFVGWCLYQGYRQGHFGVPTPENANENPEK